MEEIRIKRSKVFRKEVDELKQTRRLGYKEIEKILPILEDVAKSSKMEHANFGEHDELIKSKTRLHHGTYITGPLELAINIIKARVQNQPCSCLHGYTDFCKVHGNKYHRLPEYLEPGMAIDRCVKCCRKTERVHTGSSLEEQCTGCGEQEHHCKCERLSVTEATNTPKGDAEVE